VHIARYFVFVGGALAALLFIVGWCLPTPPAIFADQQLALDRAIIRIKSARKWPDTRFQPKRVRSDSVVVKAALLDVVDLLHQCADVHRTLHMPDQRRLTDAASYLQQLCCAVTKYRMDRLAIRACIQQMICGLKENAAGSLG
jgi:hypothetical protein